MKISDRGLNFITSFEGYHRRLEDGRCVAYKCPAGVWTLGYGCTEGIKPGMIWTEAEAVAALHRELARFEAAVTRLVTVPLNQNEYDALVSFAYNCGEGALKKSTILRRLNAGNRAGAARAFAAWNKGGGRVLPGLVRRRREEAALFLEPVEVSDEPEMPQAVEPSPEKPSRPAVAVVTAVASGSAGVAAQAAPDAGTIAQLVGCNSMVSCGSSFQVFAGARPTFIVAILVGVAAIWIGPWLWAKVRG